MTDFDPVQKARHYNLHPSGVEIVEIVENMGFSLGNAVKYVARCDLKGTPLTDLEKALYYVRRDLKARVDGRSVHEPRADCGYYPGSHEVDRFLGHEPSEFVRVVVRALWAAHKSPAARRDLQVAIDALEREIARRKQIDVLHSQVRGRTMEGDSEEELE